MSAAFFVIQSLLVRGDTEVARLGSLVVTREGLDHAGNVALRQIILVAAGMAFVATTDPYDLEIVLNRTLRLKYQYAFLISVTMVLLPLFEREVEHLRQVDQLRNPGGRSGPLPGFRQLFAIAPALISRGVRRSLTLALSIESRAFSTGVERTYGKTVTPALAGQVLMAATTVATLGWCAAAAAMRV
jgi:energy-coupling factor transport system permease protein